MFQRGNKGSQAQQRSKQEVTTLLKLISQEERGLATSAASKRDILACIDRLKSQTQQVMGHGMRHPTACWQQRHCGRRA